MNKKANTLLFILGATLFNVIVAIISCFLLLFLFSALYTKFLASTMPSFATWVFPISFLLAIVISFLVYRFVLRFLIVKIDVEKYFDPLFVRKRQLKKIGKE